MKTKKILISILFAIILVFACGRVEAANNNKLNFTIKKNNEDGLNINITYSTEKEYDDIYFYCNASAMEKASGYRHGVKKTCIREVRSKLRGTYR